jgi:hypothetical protein
VNSRVNTSVDAGRRKAAKNVLSNAERRRQKLKNFQRQNELKKAPNSLKIPACYLLGRPISGRCAKPLRLKKFTPADFSTQLETQFFRCLSK